MRYESVVEKYLREVAHHLRGIPAKQRKLLLEEARTNLVGIPAGELESRLPDSSTFARELCESAGIRMEGGVLARVRALPKTVLIGCIAGLAIVIAYAAVAAPPVRLTPGSVFNPGTEQVDNTILGELARPTYVDGAEYQFLFTIRNPGWRPLAITGFEFPDDETHALLLEGWSVEVDLAPQGMLSSFRSMSPFQPFTLGAGEERLLKVTTHFASCDQVGSGISYAWDSLSVGYRVLGWPHSGLAPLGFTVEIVSPPPGECPAG